MKVASTHELIEKLQAYEKENGVGAIVGIGTFCSDNRETEYVIEIANQPDSDRLINAKGYNKTRIDISSIDDVSLFKQII